MIKNNRGVAILLFVFAMSIVVYILTLSIQSKIDNTLALRAKSKALNDVQIAIDQFAVGLKRAYDLGTEAPSSFGLSMKTPTTTFNQLSSGPIHFYIPATELSAGALSGVSTSVNQICVNRFDMFDFLAAGSSLNKPICLEIPTDLFALLKFFEKKAYAQSTVESIYDPGDALVTAFSGVSVSGVNPGVPNFRNRYFGQLDCPTANADTNSRFFCLNVKICPKLGGDSASCLDEEFVKQTYVFFRPPKVSL